MRKRANSVNQRGGKFFFQAAQITEKQATGLMLTLLSKRAVKVIARYTQEKKKGRWPTEISGQRLFSLPSRHTSCMHIIGRL